MPDPSHRRAFLILLGASALALLLVLSPFWYVIVLAMVLASVMWPAHRVLTRRLGNRRWASGVVLMIGVSLVAVPPVGWLAVKVVGEGVRGLDQLMVVLQDDPPGSWQLGLEYGYGLAQEQLGDVLPPMEDARSGLVDALRSALVDATLTATSGVPGLIRGVWRLSLDLVAFLIALYVAFTRGPELLAGLRKVAPLEDRYVSRLYEVFQQLAMNIVLGMVATGVAQGMVAALGFAMAGVPAAIVLGAATAVTSVVPVVGSMLIWLPVVGGLVASGRPGAAVFVAVWSLAITASADNVVKPFLLKNRLKVSPLLMLVSLFGGMLTMGAKGLVFGPLLLVLYLTLYTIYLRDFLGEDPEHPERDAPTRG